MADSNEKMRILLERIAKLEETVEALGQLVRAMSKARRDTALLEVDRLERSFDIEPRTADLRKRRVA